jgi:triosephosphate isomerase
MNNKIIVANWKMNGSKALIEAYDNFFKNYQGAYTVVICPSFIHIPLCSSKNYFLGAQDCHEAGIGSHTGCISAPMLREVGVKYVILGHSERRFQCFESDEMIKRKENAALENDLIPIVCIGETVADKNAGKTFHVLEQQLKNSLNGNDKTIIAYEPIWAIGTGKIPTDFELITIFQFIKNLFPNNIIIYGGSVNQNNAHHIVNHRGVDGLLVGGACLNVAFFESFL